MPPTTPFVYCKTRAKWLLHLRINTFCLWSNWNFDFGTIVLLTSTQLYLFSRIDMRPECSQGRHRIRIFMYIDVWIYIADKNCFFKQKPLNSRDWTNNWGPWMHSQFCHILRSISLNISDDTCRAMVWHNSIIRWYHGVGWYVQEICNSIANTLSLCRPCTNPSAMSQSLMRSFALYISIARTRCLNIQWMIGDRFMLVCNEHCNFA